MFWSSIRVRESIHNVFLKLHSIVYLSLPTKNRDLIEILHKQARIAGN
jgi:hypothetical protein